MKQKNIITRFAATDISILCTGLAFIALALCLIITSGDRITVLVNKLHLNLWDWVAISLSVISLLFTALNWWAQRKTMQNTSRMDTDSFCDMLKSSYYNIIKNTVNLYSLDFTLQSKFTKEYPSEEYLQKMKLYLFEMQYSTIQNIPESYYYRLQRIGELCRFFNIHIDVTQSHLSSISISEDVKKRDMANLKAMHWLIAMQILSTMDFINPKGAKEPNRQLIKNYISNIVRELSGTQSSFLDSVIKYAETHNGQMPYIGRYDTHFLCSIFPDNDIEYHQFITKLNSLIELHCGNLKNGYGRIPMIQFNNAI